MNTKLILEKISFLRGVLDPNTVDGGPGQPGPVLRVALADSVVAELLRDISAALRDSEFAAKVREIGKELATRASSGMVAGWEDGDDICPPYRHFGPIPQPEPDPHPWMEATPAINAIALAHGLRQLASLTTDLVASAGIKSVGEAIVKRAGSQLFDEYCGTPVKPRVPGPRPKIKAA